MIAFICCHITSKWRSLVNPTLMNRCSLFRLVHNNSQGAQRCLQTGAITNDNVQLRSYKQAFRNLFSQQNQNFPCKSNTSLHAAQTQAGGLISINTQGENMIPKTSPWRSQQACGMLHRIISMFRHKISEFLTHKGSHRPCHNTITESIPTILIHTFTWHSIFLIYC